MWYVYLIFLLIEIRKHKNTWEGERDSSSFWFFMDNNDVFVEAVIFVFISESIAEDVHNVVENGCVRS